MDSNCLLAAGMITAPGAQEMQRIKHAMMCTTDLIPHAHRLSIHFLKGAQLLIVGSRESCRIGTAQWLKHLNFLILNLPKEVAGLEVSKQKNATALLASSGRTAKTVNVSGISDSN